MSEVETFGAGSTATSSAATTTTATAGRAQGQPRDPAGPRHRLPHGHQPPDAERHPGHHVDAEGEVDRLGRGHRHQGGRPGQRVGDVTAGRHVEGVGAQHPGEQHGQRALDGRDVPRGGGAADRGDEPHEAADGADGQDGLDRRPRPVPPPVGQGVADDRGAPWRRRPRPLRARPGSSRRPRPPPRWPPRPPGTAPSARAVPACWPGRPAATGSRRPPHQARLPRCRSAGGGGAGARARARRRPRSTRSRTTRTTWPSVSTGAEHHRPAAEPDGGRVRPSPARTRPRPRPGRRAGRGRRRSGRRSGAPSRGPSGSRRARWPASGWTGGCPPAGTGAPRGAPRLPRAPGGGRHRSSARATSARGRLARARGHVQGTGRGTSTSRAHHSRPKGAQEATSTTTASSTPRRAGVTVTSTVRGPRAGPAALAAGPTGYRGRMRTGPLASMVTVTALSRLRRRTGRPEQVTTARQAGNSGATRPVMSTAASRAPTAWTQPDPLEWATPAQASTATTLPTTGANHATGCGRGAEPAGTARRAGVPAGRAPHRQAPRDDHAGQGGRQPDHGTGHDDLRPEDGADDDDGAEAGDEPGAHGSDRAPQQRTSVGAWRAHVAGTGVSATIRATRTGPSPPLPSAISRWERQATATAWMSWGVT